MPDGATERMSSGFFSKPSAGSEEAAWDAQDRYVSILARFFVTTQKPVAPLIPSV